MGFFLSGAFWGSLLILLGVSLILGTSFFRVLVSLVIIYFGIRILVSGAAMKNYKGIFSDSIFKGPTILESYNIVFGKGLVDFTRADPGKSRSRTGINTVFGVCTVKIDPRKPVRVVATSAFGYVLLPNGNTITFGNSVYETKGAAKGRGTLEIEARVVFGRLTVEEEEVVGRSVEEK